MPIRYSERRGVLLAVHGQRNFFNSRPLISHGITASGAWRKGDCRIVAETSAGAGHKLQPERGIPGAAVFASLQRHLSRARSTPSKRLRGVGVSNVSLFQRMKLRLGGERLIRPDPVSIPLLTHRGRLKSTRRGRRMIRTRAVYGSQ